MNAAQGTEPGTEREFTESVRPFLATYCSSCHTRRKGRRAAGLAAVLHPATRSSGISPGGIAFARSSPPTRCRRRRRTSLTRAARQQVIDWIDATWKSEARRNDGDPGPVLARRLSNAEYNYTIRDLTGVDIRPAQEFPVDPANQAGFDNSGESLAMSPALLNEVSAGGAARRRSHVPQRRTGSRSRRTRCWSKPTATNTASSRSSISTSGRPTDYADYFRAAWIYKHRAVFGKPKATLADIAAQNKVSAKYLTTIWQALETKEDVGPLVKLQTMWRALPAPKAIANRSWIGATRCAISSSACARTRR